LSDKPKLTKETHKGQIEAYGLELNHYETYAKVLERVLLGACRASLPDAMVQSRAKSVSSFAEKVARKFEQYLDADQKLDAVHKLTDLCGARVIVQTTDQVLGVRKFIEANFFIEEADDKGENLGADRFGYRDMHYIVQLRPDRDTLLGISATEREAIGERKAEIQVRTWAQHAWADTLHDRMYKAPIKPSPDMVRTSNLLSALMEDGDRSFCHLANDLDGLAANYSSFAPKESIDKEIDVQRLILDNESDDKKRPRLALSLARLLAASGEHAAITDLLYPYRETKGALRRELLLCLGRSQCAVNRSAPDDEPYTEGVAFLAEALALCESSDVPYAPNLRAHDGLHARVLATLARAEEALPTRKAQARENYRRAYEHEPGNPYHLANMLGFEMYCDSKQDLPPTMRATLRAGIDACLHHANANIELPYGYFTAGRLALLLNEEPTYDPLATKPQPFPRHALGYYALGVRHVLGRKHCVPSDVLQREIEWLERLHQAEATPAGQRAAIDLLTCAEAVRTGKKPTGARAKLVGPVVVVAGGATSMRAETLATVRPILATALADFKGTVTAGGTDVGIPGCVGDLARELEAKDRKRFHLVAYRPERLPDDAPRHPGYDEVVKLGGEFSARQILSNWRDILAAGINPAEVVVLGFGGGSLSALDYCIALGFGASVGVVRGTKGVADAIFDDSLWAGLPNLFPLPADAKSLRAFVLPPPAEPADGDEMAKAIHIRYVESNKTDLPAKMQPWNKLEETYKKSSRQQAAYASQVLQAVGICARKVAGQPATFGDFTPEELDRMAELEHGRWNVERLRDGWRLGPRDNDKRLHPCLLPWKDLPEAIREIDRKAILAFPQWLAAAGFELTRTEEP
jgi:ppGpp synthetase/RelA/SpoT-type nucleotidyltranferase